jgi:hypothetical protein
LVAAALLPYELPCRHRSSPVSAFHSSALMQEGAWQWCDAYLPYGWSHAFSVVSSGRPRQSENRHDTKIQLERKKKQRETHTRLTPDLSSPVQWGEVRGLQAASPSTTRKCAVIW